VPSELAPEQLRRVCDPLSLPEGASSALSEADGIIGQPRATAALRFGLEMPDPGYHVFVAGPPGTGKMTAVSAYLTAAARERPVPEDWCYVYNFADPERPRALRLAAGQGHQLARDLDHLLTVAQQQLPRVFESDEYTGRRDALLKAFESERAARLEQLDARARAQGFALQVTPMGLLLVPLHHGRPMSEEEFTALSPEQRQALEQARAALDEEISRTLKELRREERAVREQIERLDRDVALYTVGGLFDDLVEKYGDVPEVVEFLASLRDDLVAQIGLFRASPEEGTATAGLAALQREQTLRRYRVNVIIDRSGAEGAPVVQETHPTYQNLIGRIEKEAHFGTLTTDFTLIRAGALQRANGGYLVLQAEDVLRQPLAWDGLKRALRNRAVAIDEPADWLGVTTVRTLRPEPIPLQVKVILVGEPMTYYLLYALDPDFRELFRVRADFDLEMPRTPENEAAFVRFVGRVCDQEKLRPFDRGALAAVIEHASRLAEDQEKLSVQFGAVADLVREASYWAGRAGAATVAAAHVRQALDQSVYRSNMIEERIRAMIARGTLLVDVDGARVGQVNGLAVHDLAGYRFGRPTRITATVGIGREGVIDVEREASLGGRLHSKGVLILAGFLVDRFAVEHPLSLSARLVFEQSYEEVEGDSASSAELYALLSRLADLPIRQGLAVTGSVNQKGEIQPIGGVNEKVEGFFAVCTAKGLTGDQGVLIPIGNLPNLMLRDEVVEAVRQGQFHIYPVRTVDEGIALLTGMPAGERDADGRFPADTVNGRVAARLRAMVEALRTASAGTEAPRDGH
jgi:lon-related putative ATP-dependent protease